MLNRFVYIEGLIRYFSARYVEFHFPVKKLSCFTTAKLRIIVNDLVKIDYSIILCSM